MVTILISMMMMTRIGMQCVGRFTDPHFPPDDTSLFLDPSVERGGGRERKEGGGRGRGECESERVWECEGGRA